jgi:hypothetical protein
MIERILLSLFDFRSVYLIKHKNKIKIGISTNPKRRLKEIERSIDSRAKILLSVKLFKAKAIEKRLHKRFEAQRAIFKGSGKTEYFRLSFLQILSLRVRLRMIQLFQFVSIIFSTSIIIFLICLIMSKI